MGTTRSNYKGRYHLLDVIRGITLISMIGYHTAWDLVYMFGVSWPWYQTRAAFYWQQSICWTFILLSGFCIPFSARKWRRGGIVFAAGLLVTAVTLVFMPADRVVYGVLTFIGSAMLITALLEHPVLEHIPAALGLVLNGYLFYMWYPVNGGWVNVLPGVTVSLPQVLYHGDMMTYLGFMDPTFYSTDYFSVLPWIWLYLAGYFLSRLLRLDGTLGSRIMRINVAPLSFIGRNTLIIYLLHQPVIYMILTLLHMGGVL